MNNQLYLNNYNPVDIKNSPELGYISGIMKSDGSVFFNKKAQSYGIRLDSKDLDFIQEFIKVKLHQME